MMHAATTQGLALLAALAIGGSAAAETGKEAYDAKCAACHSLSGPSTPAGPSLRGVMWRNIADVPDFHYTPALKALVGTWTPWRMDLFLKNSLRYAPGTDMLFALDDPQERKAIVRYLESVK